MPEQPHEAPGRPTVPRDEAFWNTFHDVNAEMDSAAKRAQCRREGHEMVWSARRDPECQRCGCDMERYLADAEAAGHTVSRDDHTVTITFGPLRDRQ